MKLTIIIPLYNVAKYIGHCIDSIEQQTLQDLEIICVDDGSSDDTCKVVESYMERDKRISIYIQDHAGAGAARNLALNKARGKYIAFLDGDDFYFDNFALETMYNEAIKNGAEVCASYRKNFINGKIENENFLTEFDCCGQSSIWINFQDHQNDWHFHSFIYKRKLLLANNINFPHYLRYQDPPFLLKVMIRVQRFLLVPVFLYCYRQSYRIFHLSELQVYHVLSGIYDNLLLADKYRYDKLSLLLCERIDTIYYEEIISHLSARILQKLCAIEIIRTNCLPSSHTLRALSNLTAALQNISYERYLFPFDKIADGQRILLYGASTVGQALYYQFINYGNGQSKIIGFIDSDPNAFAHRGFTIFLPEQLSDVQFDLIILATEKKNVADDMRKRLLKRSINDNVIFWDEHGYLKTRIYDELRRM